MYKVKIFGAGSIGNHLAHACRNKGWDVLICDPDAPALKRTQDEIYPLRYGAWDPGIRLCVNKDCPDENYDLTIIGTPPEHHLPVAADVMKKQQTRAILIEKPLCTPSLDLADEVVRLDQYLAAYRVCVK